MPESVGRQPFTRVASSYDRTRGGLDRGARHADLLLPHAGSSVVDIGVGTGAVAASLRARGRHVIGFDISLEMAGQARSRIGSRVAVADACRLPLADSSVSTCCCVWVLHLLPVEQALTEIRRVLRPGGRLLVISSSGNRPPDGLTDLVDDLFKTLRGGEAPDSPGVLGDQAERVGFAVSRSEGPLEPVSITPAEVITMIETRSRSALWDVDPDQWSSVVEPVLRRLEQLPDEPVPCTLRSSLLVLTK